MPRCEVRNLNNEVVDGLDLYDDVFAATVNKSLLFVAVRHHLDSLRQGTHATKNRSQVSGGGKKPWRQKGTGRARAGSSRNPIWRHGGVAHGPTPRKYGFHLPRKMILGALRSALTEKYNGDGITVLEGFPLQTHKTRDLSRILDKLQTKRKLLIVDLPGNENLARASGNLAQVKLVASRDVNVYDVLYHDRILFSKASILKLQEALKP